MIFHFKTPVSLRLKSIWTRLSTHSVHHVFSMEFSGILFPSLLLSGIVSTNHCIYSFQVVHGIRHSLNAPFWVFCGHPLPSGLAGSSVLHQVWFILIHSMPAGFTHSCVGSPQEVCFSYMMPAPGMWASWEVLEYFSATVLLFDHLRHLHPFIF